MLNQTNMCCGTCFQVTDYHGPVSKQWEIVNFTSKIEFNEIDDFEYKTVHVGVKEETPFLYY